MRAAALPADLSDLAQVDPLLERAEDALGPLDLLVNNAGVEAAGAFTSVTREELTATVDLNLTAPLLLTHRVLPGMLARRRGHVVVHLLARRQARPRLRRALRRHQGRADRAHPVAARRVPHGSPSASPWSAPGFIAGDGMYQRMVEEGVQSNRLMGETTLEKVADATLRAIRRDLPEVIETGAPMRPALALAQLAPGLAERVAPLFGVTEIFRRIRRLARARRLRQPDPRTANAAGGPGGGPLITFD